MSNSALTGGDLIVDTLIQLGCDRAFNIIGVGMHGLAAALYKRRSELLSVGHLNETNLCLMAQGFARKRQEPAFCFVYHASGTALSMMALTTAWADRAPLVLISSGDSRLTSGRDQYAATPRSAIEMGAQFTKWSFEVTKVERIPEILARAYAIALQPPMGPVHLSIPSDLYDEVAMGTLPRVDFARTRHFSQSMADEAGLAAAADLLAAAELPVIFAGGEVGQVGGVDALVRLAEMLGAPVMSEDMPSYLGFPTSHPQYVGTIGANKDLLSRSDAAFSAGFEFTELGLAGDKPLASTKMKLAALSADPLHASKQLWPDIALCGHPAPSLERLCDLVAQCKQSAGAKDRALSECESLRAARRKKVDAVNAAKRPASPVAPEQLIGAIRDFCGQDWTIVQIGSTAAYSFDFIYELDDPAKFHGLSGKGSAQGWGIPASIGIKMAAPQEKVLTLSGDGNLMFSATGLWAAVKNRLPMIFVVINNGGWASISAYVQWASGIALDKSDSNELGWTFGDAPVDFAALARSMGLQAGRAETTEQLADLLAQAGASNEPWLIDVVTSFGGNLAIDMPSRDAKK